MGKVEIELGNKNIIKSCTCGGDCEWVLITTVPTLTGSHDVQLEYSCNQVQLLANLDQIKMEGYLQHISANVYRQVE